MSLQDQINALNARLDAVAANVKTIEANAQPEVDLTGLESHIAALEGVVNAGLPKAETASSAESTGAASTAADASASSSVQEAPTAETTAGTDTGASSTTEAQTTAA